MACVMNVMPKASLVGIDDVARISHACCERISLEHGTEGCDHSVGNLCMLYKVYEKGGREDTNVLGLLEQRRDTLGTSDREPQKGEGMTAVDQIIEWRLRSTLAQRRRGRNGSYRAPADQPGYYCAIPAIPAIPEAPQALQIASGPEGRLVLRSTGRGRTSCSLS